MLQKEIYLTDTYPLNEQIYHPLPIQKMTFIIFLN